MEVELGGYTIMSENGTEYFRDLMSRILRTYLDLTTEHIILREEQLTRTGTMLAINVVMVLSPHTKDEACRLARATASH